MTEIRNAVEAFATGVPADATVLDVGCGMQPYAELFAHCAYVGIDVESSGRQAHEKRADRLYDGVNIPYEAESFDAVFCTQVLEHALEPADLLRDIHRVLRIGGRLMVTVPFMWGEHEAPFDFRRFSTFGIRRTLEGAGFAVVDQRRLSRGAAAIEMLVQSEINNFAQNVPRPPDRGLRRWQRILAAWAEPRVWALQRTLWRRLYRFDRIYIDNLVIAEKVV
jgi:SAM-dependent methyltransferase